MFRLARVFRRKRQMSTPRRSDPFRETLSLHDAMNQLFAQSFVQPGWGASSSSRVTAAPIDVFEAEQAYQVRVLLPGMKPEDIEVTLEQNTLTVRGRFRPSVPKDKQVTWLVQEIGEGAFERTITFPKPIDSDRIGTNYEAGILSLPLPVREESRARRISITGSQPQPRLVESEQRQRG